MPKYHFLRSYAVVEVHEIEASSPKEAEPKLAEAESGAFVKSYDGDYLNDYEF